MNEKEKLAGFVDDFHCVQKVPDGEITIARVTWGPIEKRVGEPITDPRELEREDVKEALEEAKRRFEEYRRRRRENPDESR